MELKNSISTLKFSDRVLNFFELLILERRTELVSKTALAIYLLKEDKEEKIEFLKQERRSLIHDIKELPDRPLLNELIDVMDKQRHLVHSYAELFKEILRKGLELISEDEKLYEKSVVKIESLLNSSEKNIMNASVYADLYGRKDEILNLPKIKLLTDILVYLHYLDLLYKNLDAVQKNRPVVTSLPEDNKTGQIIRDYFNELFEINNDGNSVFFNKQDYDYYVDLLTKYFDGLQYELSERKIELKSSIKTTFAGTLGQIHRRFKQTYVAEKAFFDVVRVLKPYKDGTDPKLQKALRNNYNLFRK